MRRSGSGAAAALALLVCAAAPRAQTSGEALHQEAMRREAVLRKEIDARPAASAGELLLDRSRTLAQTYEDISRLFPASDVADDALWQGAILAADTFWEFGQRADRTRALKLFDVLRARYPASPLVKQIAAQTSRLASGPSSVPAPAPPPISKSPIAKSPQSPPITQSVLRAIRREVLPDALRITIELEREAQFYDERIEGPARVFIDMFNTRPVEALRDKALTYADDVVRQIRVGREDARTRVVLDLDGAARHSVYALYSPYRVVIDVERLTPRAAPVVPSRNRSGTFSLSRQLGLGVGRIVVDPGHGGHDPGAQVRGLSEADLTLDVALKLEKRLLAQPGVEVVLTRRTNVYVTLEERTAIANRAAADLFLSIHANASADARAAGIETYVLNFASNSAAEAVAARENAGSSRTMAELPDIVKAIALNNKIDESRDVATHLQAAMFERLRRANRQVRNLGVKQAPFVVLIGATMPSVLAEISFLSNRQEAALLRTPRYRDQIAEGLANGILKYQRSLKAPAEVRLKPDTTNTN